MFVHGESPRWEPLLPSEVHKVDEIARIVHPDLPERVEVFAEKISLFPQGCRKLVLLEETVGYAISHPWKLHAIPHLDEFLTKIPEQSDCIYIHDVALLPKARGNDAAMELVKELRETALELDIPSLALVSVYGTDVLWKRFGFQSISNEQLNQKLACYGATAKYMLKDGSGD